MSKMDVLGEMLRSVGDEYCESQMYSWPGFDSDEEDPEPYFEKLGIEFDGDLFIRYPARLTYKPVRKSSVASFEKKIGLELPEDYKQLLIEFGCVHLPGEPQIALMPLKDAFDFTRGAWCQKSKTISMLAISSYHRDSDGDAIGFLRTGQKFDPTIFMFDHELVAKDKDPSSWSTLLAPSLSEFLIEHLQSR